MASVPARIVLGAVKLPLWLTWRIARVWIELAGVAKSKLWGKIVLVVTLVAIGMVWRWGHRVPGVNQLVVLAVAFVALTWWSAPERAQARSDRQIRAGLASLQRQFTVALSGVDHAPAQLQARGTQAMDKRYARRYGVDRHDQLPVGTPAEVREWFTVPEPPRKKGGRRA